MSPVELESLPEEFQRVESRPKLKPITTSLGGQIHFDGAEGIPLPQDLKERDNITKRVVRVGLYDTVKNDFVYNTSHVIASWSAKQEDIWTFNENSSLNPVLFRTT